MWSFTTVSLFAIDFVHFLTFDTISVQLFEAISRPVSASQLSIACDFEERSHSFRY